MFIAPRRTDHDERIVRPESVYFGNLGAWPIAQRDGKRALTGNIGQWNCRSDVIAARGFGFEFAPLCEAVSRESRPNHVASFLNEIVKLLLADATGDKQTKNANDEAERNA